MRDNAIRELIKNMNTNFNTERKFNMKFKNRKQSVSIGIARRDFGTNGCYAILKELNIKDKQIYKLVDIDKHLKKKKS